MERHHDWGSKVEREVLDGLVRSLTEVFGDEARLYMHSDLDFIKGMKA